MLANSISSTMIVAELIQAMPTLLPLSRVFPWLASQSLHQLKISGVAPKVQAEMMTGAYITHLIEDCCITSCANLTMGTPIEDITGNIHMMSLVPLRAIASMSHKWFLLSRQNTSPLALALAKFFRPK
jgi:hypothetical protein